MQRDYDNTIRVSLNQPGEHDEHDAQLYCDLVFHNKERSRYVIIFNQKKGLESDIYRDTKHVGCTNGLSFGLLRIVLRCKEIPQSKLEQ